MDTLSLKKKIFSCLLVKQMQNCQAILAMSISFLAILGGSKIVPLNSFLFVCFLPSRRERDIENGFGLFFSVNKVVRYYSEDKSLEDAKEEEICFHTLGRLAGGKEDSGYSLLLRNLIVKRKRTLGQ